MLVLPTSQSILGYSFILILSFLVPVFVSCDSPVSKGEDQLDPVEIIVDGINPDSGEVSTVLTISGRGFDYGGSIPELIIDDQSVLAADYTEQEASFVIPETLEEGVNDLHLEIGGEIAEISQQFKLVEFDTGDPDGDSADSFNYRIGTQTFDPKYGFSGENRLVETAREILRMGSNILKISLNPDKYNIPTEIPAEDPVALLSEEPSFRKIVEMPFTYYFFWVGSHAAWRDGYSSEERKRDSTLVGDLAIHLLEKFDGAGKQFYIGHWEGDWYLLPDYDTNYDPTELSIRGMINYYNARQNAIEVAKKRFPNSDVEVFQYAEVNRVIDAMEGKNRLTNRVLPFSNVDYVSYSAYDAQLMNESGFHKVLDYIEEHLPDKPNIKGKRVFIGEYGMPANVFEYSKMKHESVNGGILKQSLTWGVPFALYWEMFNNEIADGKQIGFWLIDNQGVKWPLYYSINHLILSGRSWVKQFQVSMNRMPTQKEYYNWLIDNTD